MKNTILTDTCFWLGLLDPSDQYHVNSKAIADLLQENDTIIPWPCLYEAISTHLVKKRERLLFMEEIIERENIILLDDSEYKQEALRQTFEFNRIHGFAFSLVDCVIREILKDVSLNINYMVTFNEKDFRDICDIRKVEIIAE